MMYDPNWVAEQLDTLWNEPGDKIARRCRRDGGDVLPDPFNAHRSGWWIGTCHGSSPTSMVYKNETTKGRTFHRLEPRATKAETVSFYEGSAKVIGYCRSPAAGVDECGSSVIRLDCLLPRDTPGLSSGTLGEG